MHLCECLQRWRWPEPPSLIVSPNCVAMFDPAGHWGGDIHLTIRQLHCGVHFFTVVPSFAPSLVQQHHHWRQVSSFFGGIYFDVCQFQCNYIFCIIVFPQVAPFPCNNGIFKVSHTTHFCSLFVVQLMAITIVSVLSPVAIYSAVATSFPSPFYQSFSVKGMIGAHAVFFLVHLNWACSRLSPRWTEREQLISRTLSWETKWTPFVLKSLFV